MTYLYFNSAGVGLMPEATQNVLKSAVEDFLRHGSARYFDILTRIESYREDLARFLDCAADEVAFTSNTSAGLRFVAAGLAIKPGDEIVVFENDFPANVMPWLSLAEKGAVIRFVPMTNGGYDLADFKKTLNAKTRLVAVSHVNFMTGFVSELGEICALAHECGALVSVDAIQSLGCLPLSLKDVPADFLSAGGHKWLRGPLGSGVFFCRKKNLDLISNVPHGWLSFEGSADFLFQGEGHFTYERELKKSARRFEGGVPSVLANFGLGESVRHLAGVGMGEVTKRIQNHVATLRESLAKKGYRILTPQQTSPSGILSFVHPQKNNREIFEELLKRNIHIAFPNGKLRVSPHYDVTEEMINELGSNLDFLH